MRRTSACVFAALAATAGCAHATLSRRGEVSPPRVETFQLTSRIFGNDRTIRVWLPPGYDQRVSRGALYPVLYLNDGFAVFSAKAWNAPDTAERLVRAGEVAPLVIVGIDNGATARPGSVLQRTREYVPWEDPGADPDTAGALGSRYPDFLLTEVLPAVEARYRVRRERDGRGIGGSSYGGVAALYTAIHHSDVFSRLLIESTPVFLSQYRVLNEAAAVPEWPKRIHIGAGSAETDDAELNEKVVADTERLASFIRDRARASRVEVVIQQGAKHGGKAWGERLGPALRFLWGDK